MLGSIQHVPNCFSIGTYSMTSVNTNVAAITALRTLQSTNQQLDATQSRISTGYKIGEAKDNAAYWAISTALTSNNKALSTVKDALGLGAATVDTAYQGLNKAHDVLDEIKKKLVAASQDGVDKTAVQGEITQLQQQLKAIASASTFSGENWLSIDSSASSFNAAKSVVSSFNRSASGAVTIDTISIDSSSFTLVDASATKSGVLDGGKTGNGTNKGGLTDMATANVGTTGTPATAGKKTEAAAFAVTSGAATDYLTVKYKIDGSATVNTYSIVLSGANFAAPGNPTIDEVVAKLNGDATFSAGAVASKDAGGTKLIFTSKTTGTTSNFEVTAAGIGTASGGTTGGTGSLAGISVAAGTAGSASTATSGAATGVGAFAAVTLDDDDMINFKVAVDGGAAQLVSVSKATVSSALGTTDGVIGTSANWATVVTKALQNAGVTGVTASDNAGTLKLVSNTVGATSSLQVTATTASKGISILGLDITNADKSTLTMYVNAVNAALNKVTSAAATLGAVASRIDLQKTFVNTLMDTIDKGVSGLIDADMSEESTKLQALQVKQQLGVQALQIANQSAQSVLSLFRS